MKRQQRNTKPRATGFTRPPLDMNETFVEATERYKSPDVSGFIEHGGIVRQKTAAWNVLYRVKFNQRSMACETVLMATLHARIAVFSTCPDTGERLYTVVGLGRDGREFSFDIRERDYWGPKFVTKICNAAGPGTFIRPGFAKATARAVYQLTVAELQELEEFND